MPIIVLGVLAAATYAGYTMSRRYIERERFFLEALLLCDKLSAEIGFSRRTLPDVLRGAAAEQKSRLGDFLSAFADRLYVYADTDAETLRGSVPQGYLKQSEYELMLSFFGALGRADAESELNTIAGFKSALTLFHSGAAAEKKKYGGLYTKLGFLCGAVIAILII